jgi:hypothetical protein
VALPAAHSFIASRRMAAKLDLSNTSSPLRLLSKLAAGSVAKNFMRDPLAEDDNQPHPGGIRTSLSLAIQWSVDWLLKKPSQA